MCTKNVTISLRSGLRHAGHLTAETAGIRLEVPLESPHTAVDAPNYTRSSQFLDNDSTPLKLCQVAKHLALVGQFLAGKGCHEHP